MVGSLTDKQYEELRQKLIVPLAVSDILYHELNVEADMQYGLHLALSEVDPDSALLAIALCAHDLGKKYARSIPIAKALEKEAVEILETYGIEWLANSTKAPLPTTVYEEILMRVPEDLEALADLMDALAADLNAPKSPTTTLINLLSIQARAHMEIAEFILDEIAYEWAMLNEGRTGKPNFGMTDMVSDIVATPAGDNIILFPGTPVSKAKRI